MFSFLRTRPRAGCLVLVLGLLAVPAPLPAQEEASPPWFIDPAAPGSATPELLVSRVECVAFTRAVIARKWTHSARAHGGIWTAARQRFWAHLEDLSRYEARFIRPFMDAQTQETMVATLWPDGLAPLVVRDATGPGADILRDDPRSLARRATCRDFLDRTALEALVAAPASALDSVITDRADRRGARHPLR